MEIENWWHYPLTDPALQPRQSPVLKAQQPAAAVTSLLKHVGYSVVIMEIQYTVSSRLNYQAQCLLV